MEEGIEIKRDKIIAFLRNKNIYIYLLILLIIIWYAASVRVSNLPLLLDKTTNDYITADPDAALYLRYAREIVENGKLAEIDNMRYYPRGLPTIEANPIIPYTIALVYKISHAINPAVTIGLADNALYPIIFFVLGSIAFFLLVARLFDKKVALLATFILAILPAYLFRTMTGVADKEVFAMFFMYIALFFYLLAWHAEDKRKTIIFGLLAGISTGIMNLAWNGANFVYMLIAINTLLNVFLDRFTKRELFAYGAWLIPTTLILMIFRYGVKGILPVVLFSITTALAYFTLAVGIIYILLQTSRFSKYKEKLTKRLPLGISSLIISFILGTLLTSILVSPGFMFSKIASIFSSLVHPFGLGRLTLTVAESYQPYFTDWMSNFNTTYILIFFIASCYLFYQLVKPLRKLRWKLTAAYVLFLVFFVPTRYSQGAAIFNGETFLSNFLYIGSLIAFISLFIILYLYSYYKKHDIFEEFKNLNTNYIFVFIWLFLMIVAARGAIRLFFTLAPVTAILSSYIIVEVVEKLFKMKDKVYKYVAIAIIAFLLLSPFPFYNGIFIKFTKQTSSAARFSGPAYNEQWQEAMKWVRDNTAEDAVFSHWWDYGYWVQTGGNRPTILDGGNHVAYWDTLMGRYVLTGQTEDQALEFLKTHDASYLLIDPTDIGKYPAYSSIGSDNNFDRLSYIAAFTADPKLVQETKNDIVYIYQGTFVLDEDFIYDGKLYPKSSSGIIGFKVPVAKDTGNNLVVRQPIAILAYRDQAIELPVECININSETHSFPDAAIKGCIKLIPTVEGNNIFNRNMDFSAAALYISERSRRALWVKLYLLEEPSQNFKLVYSDHAKIPILLFQGQIIGPLRIWQISYPSHIKPNPQYLNTTGPEFL